MKDIDVALVIQRDSDGASLIITPEGCFTSDCWYETVDAAIDAATELLGVRREEWTPVRDHTADVEEAL